MRTLFQELETTSEAVVGLEFITEFKSKVMAKKGINRFDPDNPPKFCPKCQKKGIKSKVKMRRLCHGSEKVLICKSDLVRLLEETWPRKEMC